MLKKIVSILLLSTYLLGSTQLIQFFGINNFITHYNEHKAQNKNITLLEFFDIHYLHGNKVDEDFSKDMKLPFKSEIPSGYTIAICNEPTPFSISFQPLKYFIKKNFTFYETIIHSNGYLSAVWQPPKKLA